MGEGTKGPRLFDWACVPVLHRWEDDGRHWLLIRRSLTDPQEKRYYFVFAPPGTSLGEMVKAIGARWHIEEDLENAKDLGLDHDEVRSFLGWLRHVTLVMLAHAFLVGICAWNKVHLPSPSSLSTIPQSPLDARSSAQPRWSLFPLTAPEVRHLLGCLIWPPSSSVKLVLAWSWWRRSHQSCASYYHTQRRQKARISALLIQSAILHHLSSPALVVHESKANSLGTSSHSQGIRLPTVLVVSSDLKGVLMMTTFPLYSRVVRCWPSIQKRCGSFCGKPTCPCRSIPLMLVSSA